MIGFVGMECRSLRSACDSSIRLSLFFSAMKQQRRRASFRTSVSCHGIRRHRRRRDTTGFESRPKELFRSAGNFPASESPDNGSDDDRIVLTLDLHQIKRKAETLSESAKTSLHASASRAVRLGNLIVNDGRMFFEDLRSSISVQKDRRVVISLRRSSFEFAFIALLGCVLFATAWKILAMAAKKYRWGWEESFGPNSVFKRDRSLGGREVFVGKTAARDQTARKEKQNVMSMRRKLNPLDAVESSRSEKDMIKQRESKILGKSDSQLPEWWPSPTLSLASYSPGADTTTHGKKASSLLKTILEKRSTGKDFEPDDILQLYQMSKYSGICVTFDSPYARDSFYRAAVNMALSSCGLAI